MPRGNAQALEFIGDAALVALLEGFAEGSGVQFHDRRAHGASRLHDLDVRLDEERDADAGIPQFAHGAVQVPLPPQDVEAAFGRALLAPLRHEAGGMGADARGDRDHLGGRRHLEVERREELSLQSLHIMIADMPAVLAEMRGDAVCPGEHGEMGGADRVRMVTATRISHCGHMIDVDAEADRRSFHEPVFSKERLIS